MMQRLSRKKKKFLQNDARRPLPVCPFFNSKYEWLVWWLTTKNPIGETPQQTLIRVNRHLDSKLCLSGF